MKQNLKLCLFLPTNQKLVVQQLLLVALLLLLCQFGTVHSFLPYSSSSLHHHRQRERSNNCRKVYHPTITTTIAKKKFDDNDNNSGTSSSLKSIDNTSTSMVNLYGQTTAVVSSFRRRATGGRTYLKAKGRISGGAGIGIGRHNNNNNNSIRPLDPQSLITSPEILDEKAQELVHWFHSIHSKKNTGNSISNGNILVVTGAGLSTDSGIPDYRGHKGSYHVGHKPMIYQQFMDSIYHRKRYYGRSMFGYNKFANSIPNNGHHALAQLERMGIIGVTMDDQRDFYNQPDREEFMFTSGSKRLAIITQNVDSLHHKAGSHDILSLHGRNKIVECVHCGHQIERTEYQQQLEILNNDWIKEHTPTPVAVATTAAATGISFDEKQSEVSLITQDTNNIKKTNTANQQQLRPDGDAEIQNNNNEINYNDFRLPPCPCCHPNEDGFYRPDVVFFGDSVPKHRVAICQQAVHDCDGILAIGSSLTVHSVFRHIKAATSTELQKPVAILNVGETRAEIENLTGITKIEAPIGDTLERAVQLLSK